MEYAEYITLKSRVNILEQRYLPQFEPTASYSEKEVDDMRALRLLAHAEIEVFLETLSETLANDLKQAYQHSKTTPHSAITHQRWCDIAIKLCKKNIHDNNGVKEKNIRALFEPLGIADSEFDAISPVFLKKMSQFGEKRGEVAHKSALRATHAITAQGEKKLLDEIMQLLRDFCVVIHQKRLHINF